METALVLAALAQRGRFSLVGPPVRPAPAITLQPEHGILATVHLAKRGGGA